MEYGERAAGATLDFLRARAEEAKGKIATLEDNLARERALLQDTQKVIASLETILDAFGGVAEGAEELPQAGGLVTVEPNPTARPNRLVDDAQPDAAPRRQRSTRLVVQVLESAHSAMTKEMVVTEMRALGYTAQNVDNAVNTALLRAHKLGRINRDEVTGAYSSLRLAAANPGDGPDQDPEAGD